MTAGLGPVEHQFLQRLDQPRQFESSTVYLPVDHTIPVDYGHLVDVVETTRRREIDEADILDQAAHGISRAAEKIPVGIIDTCLAANIRMASGVSTAVSKPTVMTWKLSSPSASRAASTALARCRVMAGHTWWQEVKIMLISRGLP